MRHAESWHGGTHLSDQTGEIEAGQLQVDHAAVELAGAQQIVHQRRQAIDRGSGEVQPRGFI